MEKKSFACIVRHGGCAISVKHKECILNLKDDVLPGLVVHERSKLPEVTLEILQQLHEEYEKLHDEHSMAAIEENKKSELWNTKAFEMMEASIYIFPFMPLQDAADHLRLMQRVELLRHSK